MQKIGLIILVSFVFLLFGCQKETTSEQEIEEKPLACYVGTYAKTTAMGETLGGHLLIFNEDKSVDIYSGMFSGMGGASAYLFSGTYEKEGKNLTIDYQNLETEESYRVETEIKDNYFRAQLQTEGGAPNDGLVPDEPGLYYYEISPFNIPSNVDTIYIGSNSREGELTLSVFIMKSDLTFVYIYQEGEIVGLLEGEYEIEVGDIDTPNNLVLTYYEQVLKDGCYVDSNNLLKTSLIYDSVSLDISIPLNATLTTTSVKTIACLTPVM